MHHRKPRTRALRHEKRHTRRFTAPMGLTATHTLQAAHSAAQCAYLIWRILHETGTPWT